LCEQIAALPRRAAAACDARAVQTPIRRKRISPRCKLNRSSARPWRVRGNPSVKIQNGARRYRVDGDRSVPLANLHANSVLGRFCTVPPGLACGHLAYPRSPSVRTRPENARPPASKAHTGQRKRLKSSPQVYSLSFGGTNRRALAACRNCQVHRRKSKSRGRARYDRVLA